MRPKIAVWSDYRSPARKRWRSPYRRSARSSIGLKILLFAVVSVGCVVGISGIYPQIIDSEWAQNAGTRAKRTIAEAMSTRRSGMIAAIPLSPRGAATTGDAAVSPPRVLPAAPAAAEPPRAKNSVVAVQSSPNETALPPADIPDAAPSADPPVEPALTAAPAVKPAQRYVPKRRVVRTERHRSNSGAYAQYGGWGGGWGAWPGMSSPYHF
jgi:hypothetical protein